MKGYLKSCKDCVTWNTKAIISPIYFLSVNEEINKMNQITIKSWYTADILVVQENSK